MALKKITLLTFIPASPGQQGEAASGPHPAYCTTETVTERVFIQAPSPPFPLGAGRFEIQTRRREVCFPASQGSPGQVAIPATPAQWKTNHNIGWNSGAHSVIRLNGDVQATFRVPTAGGVIVGFNTVSKGVGFQDVKYGIFCRDGVARAYESGAPRGEVLPFESTDLFIIERVNGVVSFYRQFLSGTPVLFYQSPVLSSGSLVLDSSLYSGGDTID